MREILLYNTLGNKEEEFKPITPDKIGMYVCGPTVYGFDHLGHARTYVFFDVLKRFLVSSGYQVKYVQNITDIGHLVDDSDSGEDKLEKQAKTEGKTPEEIARFYEEAHFTDMVTLGNNTPDFTPRASEYIPQIIQHIELLLEKGLAYTTPKGNVYFTVKKYPQYGELSHRTIDSGEADTRVTTEPDKQYPADFSLWKATRGDETRVYDSPWSKGIPGWHIECSVMSRQLLGQPFDIHGAAVEHVFPHHENEIAQSGGAYGLKLANYWVHTGLLTIKGQKMGKSLGNSLVIRDLIKTVDPMVLRLILLSAHYRKPLDYHDEMRVQWENIWQNIKKVYTISDTKKEGYLDKFSQFLADDINIPGGINYLIQNLNEIGHSDLTKILDILGLKYILESIPDKIAILVKERNKARRDKNWELSDQLRFQIEKEGYLVEDSDTGSKVIKK